MFYTWKIDFYAPVVRNLKLLIFLRTFNFSWKMIRPASVELIGEYLSATSVQESDID